MKDMKEKRKDIKLLINSMYGSIGSASMIPVRFFRPTWRRIKIQNIFAMN